MSAMDAMPPSPGAKQPRKRGETPRVSYGSREARRLTALILEVLAGQRTPTEAAKALQVSVPRYYALETQALQGLVAACEPRRRGPRNTPEREIQSLRREVERLKRECSRTQALLRFAQRTAGGPAAARPTEKQPGKRRRKPSIRALKAVASLAQESADNLPSVEADAKSVR